MTMNEAVFKSILHKVRGTGESSQTDDIDDDIDTVDAKLETTTPETLAAAILAENKPDEVARILAIWRSLGIKDLDRRRVDAGLEPVGEHLANLREWQRRWTSGGGGAGE